MPPGTAWHPPDISTHALREEDDGDLSRVGLGGGGFLPTPSARRATVFVSQALADILISTHALREEGDPRPSPAARALRDFYPRPPRGGRRENVPGALSSNGDFYPRPPRGGRPHKITNRRQKLLFLPTPSARRATQGVTKTPDKAKISTHALREEGDRVMRRPCGLRCYNFYPRPPRGGRPRTS